MDLAGDLRCCRETACGKVVGQAGICKIRDALTKFREQIGGRLLFLPEIGIGKIDEVGHTHTENWAVLRRIQNRICRPGTRTGFA